MNIRVADKNDINNNLLNLYIEGYNMHSEKRVDIIKEKSNEELKKNLIDMLENKDETILVIDYNGIIIGYAAISQYKNNVTNTIWIEQIIIDNKYRNKGYGKELIKEISEFAKKNNCGRIELNCWSFNEDALKFYEKIGFKEQRVILEKEVK